MQQGRIATTRWLHGLPGARHVRASPRVLFTVIRLDADVFDQHLTDGSTRGLNWAIYTRGGAVVHPGRNVVSSMIRRPCVLRSGLRSMRPACLPLSTTG